MFEINPTYQHVLAKFGPQACVLKFLTPTPAEAREYYRNVRPRWKTKDREQVFETAERDHALKIIDRSLIEVSKLDGEKFDSTLDEIKSALRDPRVGESIFAIVNTGLFGTTDIESDEDDGKEEDNTFGALFAAAPVMLAIERFNPEKREVFEHHVRFHLRNATAKQSRESQRAQEIVRGRKGTMEAREQVDVITRIFGERIQWIENASYYPNGAGDEAALKPCDEDLRDQWIEYVPYSLIASVMAADKVRVEVGNG